MPRRHLAILSNNYRRAYDWIVHMYGDNLVSYSSAQAGGVVRLHNVDIPFIIACSEDRLRGFSLMGYEIVGHVSTEMLELAKMQVRD